MDSFTWFITFDMWFVIRKVDVVKITIALRPYHHVVGKCFTTEALFRIWEKQVISKSRLIW